MNTPSVANPPPPAATPPPTLSQTYGAAPPGAPPPASGSRPLNDNLWTPPPTASQGLQYSPDVPAAPSGPPPSALPTYTEHPNTYAWAPTTPKAAPLPPSGQFYMAPSAAAFQPVSDNAVNYSKLTGLSTASSVYKSNDVYGGFCEYNHTNPQKIDATCKNLDPTVCASTQCCVLLGGDTCVAGGSTGPLLPSYYTDPTIMNRDRYYYQGKCYGNCPNNVLDNYVAPAVSAAAAGSSVAAPVVAATPAPPAAQAPVPAATKASGISYAEIAEAALIAGAILL